MSEKQPPLKREESDADFAALSKEYAPLIDSMTEKYFRQLGADYEDVRQEASLAFYRAFLSFDRNQEKVSFGLYAKICIRNRLISLLRKSRSRKKRAEKRVAAPAEEPFPFDKKELFRLTEKLLTEYERKVFWEFLSGKSYRDIAATLGKTPKSVGNALFRARVKLRNSDPFR